VGYCRHHGNGGARLFADDKTFRFTYVLKNTGPRDFRIDSLSEVQILGRLKDGSLSQPLQTIDKILTLPVFIPARQQGRIMLSFAPSDFDIPPQRIAESDGTFQERIWSYLRQNYGSTSGFVIFDSSSRYQIDLPNWLNEAPKEQTP
jgi:alkylated DNA nucleotide flippase Atl1